MSRKNKIKMNIGTSSFVVIFVILCLVTFAVLSLVSATANQRIALKSVEQIDQYFELNNHGQQILSNIDYTLNNLYQTSVNEESYYQEVNRYYPMDEHHDYAFVIDGDTQSLSIKIQIHYPQSGDPYYTIIDWNKVPNQEWTPENNINLL